MAYFEEDLNNAISICEGTYPYDKRGLFYNIYPFTTENISGYIKLFNLKNKSLLTVGSSCDQSINATLQGCFDQTIYDICSYTKYYFYLKKSAIEVLTYKEFCDFFAYRSYFVDNYANSFIARNTRDNPNVFNLESYEKIKRQLRLNDYESYLFWEELFSNFPGKEVRSKLFKYDEDRFETLRKMSPYIYNEKMFNKTKKIIKYLKPKFITDDIYNLNIQNKYDNIFLSNIACCESDMNRYKEFIDQLYNYLNEQGDLLLSYLYRTDKDTEYVETWQKIYDLDNTFKLFNNYNLEQKSFTGVNGILWEKPLDHDSVLILKKR